MNQVGSVELASLRFQGQRFERRTLDVESTAERVAYRRLVLECAEQLWRRKYVVGPANPRQPA